MKAWRNPEYTQQAIEELSCQLGVSATLASLLLDLGVGLPTDAQRFLNPTLKALEDPFLLPSVDLAVERIQQAIEQNEKVVVVGDYDVDGITSTALLVSILKKLGCSPEYLVPRRMEEGYGLSMAVVERALNGQPNLLIALDCGTNSVSEVAFLRDQGVDVLIVDHHRSKDAMPEDCILINPYVCEPHVSERWGYLCAVGLVFKLVHALIKKERQENNPVALNLHLRHYLDLVALGTVADLVPLCAENRILTRYGLESLSRSAHPGVQALFRASGLDFGQKLCPVDISFKLGPRINASGRLADAIVPLEMLLCEDVDLAHKYAFELDQLNKERQKIERAITEEAQRWVEANQQESFGLVVHGVEWHSGVVGIVAGKLAREFNRPSIVLGSEGGLAKGSGRSIEGVNLVEVLSSCEDLLENWGGHPMAVGISLRQEQVSEFRRRFDAEVVRIFEKGIPEPELKIACWITQEELGTDLLKEMDLLRPFGQGNKEPILGLRAAKLRARPLVFAQKHYRFEVLGAAGAWIQGIAWNQADCIPSADEPIDIAFKFNWNYWNGNTYPQIELIDWRRPE